MLTEDGLFKVGEEMVETKEAENIKDQFWSLSHGFSEQLRC